MHLNILPFVFQNHRWFEKSSAINDFHSNKNYVHLLFGFLLFPLATLFAWNHHSELKIESKTVFSNRTLFIEYIPKRSRSNVIRRIKSVAKFLEEDPVVHFIYDLTVFQKLKRKHNAALQALEYCQRFPDTRMFNCCWRDSETTAIGYYREKEFELRRELQREKELAESSKVLNKVFVTFSSPEEAEKVFKAFEERKVNYWKVSIAPDPEDIQWGNLNSSKY